MAPSAFLKVIDNAPKALLSRISQSPGFGTSDASKSKLSYFLNIPVTDHFSV